MSPPRSMVLPSYAEAIAKIMVATSTPPSRIRLSSFDRRILPFVDVEAEEHNEHLSGSEDDERMEDDTGSYGGSTHGST